MNENWFCTLLQKRWNAVKEKLNTAILFEIDRFVFDFEDDFNQNFELWNVFNKKINQEPLALLKLKSFRENAEHLRKWYTDRYAYLDELFNSDALYEQGGFESSGWPGGGWWN